MLISLMLHKQEVPPKEVMEEMDRQLAILLSDLALETKNLPPPPARLKITPEMEAQRLLDRKDNRASWIVWQIHLDKIRPPGWPE